MLLAGTLAAQPKLNIPYSGLSFSTTFITPSTTIVTADMYVQNLDTGFVFNDTLYIKVGVKDTLGQVFEMSTLNVGDTTINTLDSIFLDNIDLAINTSFFAEGNNTVVIWPAAPNSQTLDSIELIFFYNGINELTLNDINVKAGPIPAQNQLSLNDPENMIQCVRIKGLDGRVLLQERKSKTIDVSRLPNGSYILELITAKGIVKEKILIAR
jgi:hypothetical protein